MAESNNRVKYAYLNYNEISERLRIGDIDEYDVIFTKDTHEQYGCIRRYIFCINRTH